MVSRNIPRVLFLAIASSVCVGFAQVWADTPTDTPTCTVTPSATASPISGTPTPTPTPIIIQTVRINHNQIRPLANEQVQVLGLGPDQGEVSIQVFTNSGRLVRTLLAGQPSSGMVVSWDGKNEQGEIVASGVYIIRAAGQGVHQRMRIVIIK